MSFYAARRPDDSILLIQVLSGTVEEAIAKWPEDKRREIAEVAHVDAVPKRDILRDAWVLKNGAISIDMDRARECLKKKMRQAREVKLLALDVDQLRGLDVSAEKQKLRDVTDDPRIAKAKTPDALKAIWPDFLGDVNGD